MRAAPTATLLPDGRVLVVGGLSVTLRDGGVFPNQPVSAEIYNPLTNSWSATAPMSLYRLDQTATPLRDGRVLVAGGQDGLMNFSSSEIYDPGQDRWYATASMTTGRAGHTAILLLNGGVLVSGGDSRTAPSFESIPLSGAEVYDPRVDRWSAVASMAIPRVIHTATLLSSGKVLLVGNIGQSRAEIYDPVRNLWATISGPMDRNHQTATRLPDGRVLVIGGAGSANDWLDSVLVYDPSGTPPQPRQPSDFRLGAGLLLVTLVVLAAAALFIPNVRRRVRGSRPRREPEEWIS